MVPCQAYPKGFGDVETPEDWDAIIEKMIVAFELIEPCDINTDEEEKIIDEGIALFAFYFRALWT